MAKAKIFITLKKTIMDAQGQTVLNALQHLGYAEVKSLRIGKYLEMELEGNNSAALKQRVEEMCAKLIANPIIEDFRVEIEQDKKPSGSRIDNIEFLQP